MKSAILDPSTYYFNYNAIIPSFVVLILISISIYVFLKEKNSASVSFILYLFSKVIWFVYLFNARPWYSIKEETLLEQKGDKKYCLIFDDNINKLMAKWFSRIRH